MKQEYDEQYFEKTAEDVGLILKERRPLWRRWVKIIRKYKPSGKILDVGCGQGFFLGYAKKYFDTSGLDVSVYCIKESKCRTHLDNLLVCDATSLSYKSGSFDIVTCFDLLEHLPNPELALKEIYRVLKNEGILIIRVPNISSIGATLKKEEWFGCRDKSHLSLLSNEEWLGLLEGCGFKILEVFYDGLWDTPYFKKVPKILQDIFIKFSSLILFWLGLRFPKKYGDNLCVIVKRF